MCVLKKERGVLKLVHPGRYIEIHKKPVTAAEIMQKNPRHSVTRPDVFVFPWIVVKPDSVLKPGNVFFIVPNHALYALLKSRNERNSKKSLAYDSRGNIEIQQQMEDHSKTVFQTARDFYLGMGNAGAAETHGNDDATENGSTLTLLRSCISSSDSERKLLRLRVTFLLPGNDEEQGLPSPSLK